MAGGIEVETPSTSLVLTAVETEDADEAEARKQGITKEALLTREFQVWALRCKGYTQARIGREMGLSQPTISQTLKRISARLLSTMGADVLLHKQEQVGRLDYIIEESLEAWHRSKEAAKTVGKKETKGGATADGAAKPDTTETVMKSEDQDGDPRYLQVAMQALADQRKVMGTDAPTKVDARVAAQIEHHGTVGTFSLDTDIKELADAVLTDPATRRLTAELLDSVVNRKRLNPAG